MTNYTFVLVSRIANWGLRLQIKTCLTLAAFTVMTSLASATPIELAKASFRLAAKETLLTKPQTPQWIMAAMSDSPSQRRANRNKPWLEIQNESIDGVYLTEFHLTIGDERFHFANNYFENFTVISPTSTFREIGSHTIEDQNELVVMFDNGGLAPGQKVRFRLEIGVDADQTTLLQQSTHPDFRTVLFDMNGIDAHGSFPFATAAHHAEDNSSGYGIFKKGETIIESASTTLADFSVQGATAHTFNQYYRNWRGPEEVNVFSDVVTTMVPEPDSFLLSTLGIAIFGLFMGRRPSGTCERPTYGNHAAKYRRRNSTRPHLNTSCRHRKLRNATR
jgi:hypothetical protein